MDFEIITQELLLVEILIQKNNNKLSVRLNDFKWTCLRCRGGEQFYACRPLICHDCRVKYGHWAVPQCVKDQPLTCLHGCLQPGKTANIPAQRLLRSLTFCANKLKSGSHRILGLSNCKNHTSFFFFFAFISMRNYSGLLNPVSINALLRMWRTTAFVFL